MARALRIEYEGAIHHVTARGLEKRPIVEHDGDRSRWLDLFDRVATRYRWEVYAWALLDNHYHLFLRTPYANLATGMHDLNSGYVSDFNRRHDRVGPLLQGRYKAVLVEEATHEWELSRYVHLNPVRAGLVGDPEDYFWSSCRCYFHSALAPKWLAWESILSQHGRTVRAAREHYRAYLARGMEDPPLSPLRDVQASTLLGSPAFVERMKRFLADTLPDHDVPAARELKPMPDLNDVEQVVCEAYDVERRVLHGRSRANTPRRLAIALARRVTTLPLTVLGEYFGGVRDAAVCNAARGVEADPVLAKQLDVLESKIHQ
ncbi:MAG TPA: transposase [bacterium]|nr:transposase [bacterium]